MSPTLLFNYYVLWILRITDSTRENVCYSTRAKFSAQRLFLIFLCSSSFLLVNQLFFSRAKSLGTSLYGINYQWDLTWISRATAKNGFSYPFGQITFTSPWSETVFWFVLSNLLCFTVKKDNDETIRHKNEELKNRGNSLNTEKVRETGVFNSTAIFWRIVYLSMNFPSGLVEQRGSWLGKSVHF